MGRPNKPISVLKAQGTWRKGRHGEEATSGTEVEIPGELDGYAGEFWARNIPKLQNMGVLDGIDSEFLFALARWYGVWRECDDLVNAIQKGEKEGKIYGAITQSKMAFAAFTELAKQFGLSPVARAKLAAKSSDETDEFAEYLKRKPA